MSTVEEAEDPGAHVAGAHDASGHDFDGEPARTLPADEPRTPGWVPAVGFALFVSAGIALLATGDSTPSPAAMPAAMQAAPTPVPEAPPAAVQAPSPAIPRPPPSGQFRIPSAEEAKVLRERFENARKAGKLPPLKPRGKPAPAPAAPPAEH